jgi:NAD(P)H-hydrate repair Nnr-like enzyme with NAD(P)H-hydrate dehydratase domain
MQKSLIKRIGSIMPGLNHKAYKGDNGRIAVIGGSY